MSNLVLAFRTAQKYWSIVLGQLTALHYLWMCFVSFQLNFEENYVVPNRGPRSIGVFVYLEFVLSKESVEPHPMQSSALPIPFTSVDTHGSTIHLEPLVEPP